MKLFIKNPSMRFEWNAASELDWSRLQHLFIYSYSGTYARSDLSQLALGHFTSLEKFFKHEFEIEK